MWSNTIWCTRCEYDLCAPTLLLQHCMRCEECQCWLGSQPTTANVIHAHFRMTDLLDSFDTFSISFFVTGGSQVRRVPE